MFINIFKTILANQMPSLRIFCNLFFDGKNEFARAAIKNNSTFTPFLIVL